MKTETELFENALDTTSVNGKKLRKYINENYISKFVLDKIRDEIVEMRSKQNCSCADCLDIIDKYKVESEDS